MQTVRVLTPRPPIPALVVAAAADVLAVLLIGTGGAGGWVGLPVLGWVLLLVGSALVVWVSLGWQRTRVRVVLDDDGYRIGGPDGERRGSWGEVTRVTGGPDRLVLHHGDERRTVLVDPRGGSAGLTVLGDEMARFLDRSRGYGTTAR